MDEVIRGRLKEIREKGSEELIEEIRDIIKFFALDVAYCYNCGKIITTDVDELCVLYGFADEDHYMGSSYEVDFVCMDCWKEPSEVMIE